MRRPSAGLINVASTRNKLVLPLPLVPVSRRAPPAERRNESPAKTRRSPRRQARASATRSGAGSVNARGREKSGSGGGKPEPRGHGRIARPSTRFGGQTCKDQPYTCYMGSRLRPRFEKFVTFRRISTQLPPIVDE